MTIKSIRKKAEKYGWHEIKWEDNTRMISFAKEIDGYNARINVYTTKMTVGTCINHPKRGKTQLFRKHVTPEEMVKIFENPRVHTRKGYYEKRKSNG